MDSLAFSHVPRGAGPPLIANINLYLTFIAGQGIDMLRTSCRAARKWAGQALARGPRAASAGPSLQCLARQSALVGASVFSAVGHQACGLRTSAMALAGKMKPFPYVRRMMRLYTVNAGRFACVLFNQALLVWSHWFFYTCKRFKDHQT